MFRSFCCFLLLFFIFLLFINNHIVCLTLTVSAVSDRKYRQLYVASVIFLLSAILLQHLFNSYRSRTVLLLSPLSFVATQSDMELTFWHFAPSWGLNVLLRCLLVLLRFPVLSISLTTGEGFLRTFRTRFVAGYRPELETQTKQRVLKS